MSVVRLILASLIHHWRTNVAVACGVAAGTAVLTGALLVGDSMRGSLQRLTLDRLGSIDEALLTDRFFRMELAGELAVDPKFKKHFDRAVPVIILEAGLANTDPEDKKRANRVNLIGCDSRFWELGSDRPGELTRNQIVLNRPLAERLGVDPDDRDARVRLRLPDLGTVPGDSLLGRKNDTVQSPVLDVKAVIPAEGVGRFDLRPNQQLPLNAYVSLGGLQGRLEKRSGRPGRVNAMLVTGKDESNVDVDALAANHRILAKLLDPAPADYGIAIAVREPNLPADEKARHRYINITSGRMLLEPEVEAAVFRALKGEQFQPVLTYLANTIDTQRRDPAVTDQDDDGKIIPYSIITAVDFARAPPLGPFVTPDGDSIKPLDETDGKQIVLNSKAADDLGVQKGAKIYVTYFEPESTHGQARERTAEFELAAIVDLAGPARDRAFTPTVPGVTDEQSMYKWKVPFSPFYGGLIRHKDDVYFREHGLTPKAFVSLEVGQQLWGSRRFGQTTGFRVTPSRHTTVENVTERLRRELEPGKLGFAFQPVKQQGLKASDGTTPFSVLFLSFSFFIIAAAVMLVALLFRLGIDRRAAEIGILAAVGFRRRRIALLLAGEGACVAVAGSLLGVPAGVGYAALMLLGLRTWWVAAVVTPFLQLHLTPPGHVVPISLLIGLASGVIVALLTIVWTVWRTRHLAPRQLLAGRTSDEGLQIDRPPRLAGKAAWAVLIAAVALGLFAVPLGEEWRALAFFGTGALVLVASLMLVWMRLRAGTLRAAVAVGRGNLLRIALRNAARNPGRSTLTVGLVASASFLIVAISAFRIDPTQQVPTLHSGNGGFALVAQSDQPVYQDLNTAEGRRQLGLLPKDAKALDGTATIALRVKPGDDASCLNLYQPREPRVLGIPGQLIDRGGFAFADSAAESPEERKNPWLLLEKPLKDDPDGVQPVPVILEKNTATYSLHLGGVGEIYEISDLSGGKIRLKVVGLLAGSIFQGDLLIGETALIEHFPEISGYRLFLTEFRDEPTPKQIDHARDALRDAGLDAETSGTRLARFLAVQNTYLLTFQNLGGLGLLLGTFGLAAVQLRNVLERRSELALLRAVGFRRRTLAAMVMLENVLLLCAGLGCGVAAALAAVLPHLIFGGASIPAGSLAATLAAVLAVGLAAGLLAVRAALTAPLLPALREERA